MNTTEQTPEIEPTEKSNETCCKSFSAKNGLVIVCAIVSIITCCFSLNLATTKYKESAENLKQFHQQLIRESKQIKQASKIEINPANQNVSHKESL